MAGQLAVVIKNVASVSERPRPAPNLATQAIIGQRVVVEGGQKDWLFSRAGTPAGAGSRPRACSFSKIRPGLTPPPARWL